MTEWALANPWLTFVLLLVFGVLIIGGIIFSVGLALRHGTIRSRGYPPAYCDADGDQREGIDAKD